MVKLWTHAKYCSTLRESVEADAVLFVLVVKQEKISFCCLVCCLGSKFSGLCLSVFADKYQYLLISAVLP